MNRVLLLSLTLCLGACAGKNVAVTNPAAVRPAKPVTAPVEVFVGGELPTRPYTTVAVAQVEGDASDFRENIQELQQQARKLGADAVIIRSSAPVADRGPFRTTYQSTKEGSIVAYR